ENMNEEELFKSFSELESFSAPLIYRRFWGPYGLPTPSSPKCPVLITGIVDDGSIYLPGEFRQLPAAYFGAFLQKFTSNLPAKIAKAYSPTTEPTIQKAANRLITDVLFYYPNQLLQ